MNVNMEEPFDGKVVPVGFTKDAVHTGGSKGRKKWASETVVITNTTETTYPNGRPWHALKPTSELATLASGGIYIAGSAASSMGIILGSAAILAAGIAGHFIGGKRKKNFKSHDVVYLGNQFKRDVVDSGLWKGLTKDSPIQEVEDTIGVYAPKGQWPMVTTLIEESLKSPQKVRLDAPLALGAVGLSVDYTIYKKVITHKVVRTYRNLDQSWTDAFRGITSRYEPLKEEVFDPPQDIFDPEPAAITDSIRSSWHKTSSTLKERLNKAS